MSDGYFTDRSVDAEETNADFQLSRMRKERGPKFGPANEEPVRTAPAYVMWKTREGKLVRVVDMDDSHLFNTIKMLEAAAEIKAGRAGCDVEPEWLLNRQDYQTMVAIATARGIDLSHPRIRKEYAELERERKGVSD